MKLLLDTHVAIWLLTDRARIARTAMDMICDPRSEVFVSVIAVWEIAIKHRLARPDSPPFSGQAAILHFETAGFTSLPVKATHAAFVERLPPLHADPFDRLMLAQAVIEGMQFVTYDRHLARYDVSVMTWP